MQDCTRGYRSPREWGAKKPPAILCNIRIGMQGCIYGVFRQPVPAPPASQPSFSTNHLGADRRLMSHIFVSGFRSLLNFRTDDSA